MWKWCSRRISNIQNQTSRTPKSVSSTLQRQQRDFSQSSQLYLSPNSSVPGTMDADAFRKAAHAAIEDIIKYNEDVANNTLPVLPAIKPGYLAPQLPTTAPQSPESWLEDVQPDIKSKIVPGLTHWQSPNFMAFFPACTTYPSILGEMYSSAFTAPAFNWLCSPACTELETVVLDWICKALALPDEFLSTSPNGGGGVIQGSASEAIVTCMVAARERYLHSKCDAERLANPSTERDDRIAQLRGKLVALSTDQAHSSTHKGANIAGTRYRSIPTSFEHDLALQPDDLDAAIKQCLDEGLEPYYITITMGTTSTCATDPFTALYPVFREKYKHLNIWVHIDAAYAGTALICPEISSSLPSSSISIADSFNTNLHKWLLTSFDASLLYVQNRTDLTSALSISPAYLQNKHTDSGLVTDYRDWQIPLGRRFRALKIWFVVRTYGLDGLQAHIRNTINIGNVFTDLVRARSDLFEIVAAPAYGLTCFRIKPAAIPSTLLSTPTSDTAVLPNGDVAFATEEQIAALHEPDQTQLQHRREALANDLTKRVTDTLNDTREIFLTSSSTHGKTFIRVVSGNANAEEKWVCKAFERILHTTELALKGDLH